MIEQIKNKDDIKQFVDYLYNKNIIFHWDDDFNEYDDTNGVKSFTYQKAAQLNYLMEECKEVDSDFLESYSIQALNNKMDKERSQL